MKNALSREVFVLSGRSCSRRIGLCVPKEEGAFGMFLILIDVS